MLDEQKRLLADNLQEKKIQQEKQHRITSSADYTGQNLSFGSESDLLRQNQDDFYADKIKTDDGFAGINKEDYQKDAMAEKKQSSIVFQASDTADKKEYSKGDTSGAYGQRQQYVASKIKKQVSGTSDLRNEMKRQLGNEYQEQSGSQSSQGQESQTSEQQLTSTSVQPVQTESGSNLTGLNAAQKDAKKDAKKDAQREAQKEAQKEAVQSAAEDGGNLIGHVFSAIKSSAKIAVTTTSRVLTVPSEVSRKVSQAEQIKDRIVNMEVEKTAYDTAVKTTTKAVKKMVFSIGKYLWKVITQFLKKEFVVLMLLFPLVIQVPVVLLVVFVAQNSGDNYRMEESTSIEDSTSTDGNRSEEEIINGYVFFNQGDYNNAMGVGSDGRVRTIAGSGCGLTAIASVLCKWTGRTDITPEVVLKYALNGESGTRCRIVLISSSLISGLCNQYGLTYKTIVPKDRDELREALNTGKSVIVLLSNRARWSNGNYVTSNTHYIVLMGYSESGTIMCMNPAGGTLCYITEDTVVNDTGTDTFHVIYKE